MGYNSLILDCNGMGFWTWFWAVIAGVAAPAACLHQVHSDLLMRENVSIKQSVQDMAGSAQNLRRELNEVRGQKEDLEREIARLRDARLWKPETDHLDTPYRQ